jgi:molybdopterin/thiamine biosynthesis adenylyltransferase
MENTNRRFQDAPFMKKQVSILIGGIGGIGSHATYFLSSLGHDLTLCDTDIVEEENIGTQFHSINNIRELKIFAIKSLVRYIKNSNFNPSLIATSVTEETELPNFYDIYISAFDNMKARKAMLYHFEEALEFNKDAILIDGRLLAEDLQIITVTKDNIEEYKARFIFDDEEVEDLACTYKATSHFGGMIGTLITNIVCNHVTNLVEGCKLRRVPFFIQYNGLITNFITEDYGE